MGHHLDLTWIKWNVRMELAESAESIREDEHTVIDIWLGGYCNFQVWGRQAGIDLEPIWGKSRKMERVNREKIVVERWQFDKSTLQS
jgi:hypothetical protein